MTVAMTAAINALAGSATAALISWTFYQHPERGPICVALFADGSTHTLTAGNTP